MQLDCFARFSPSRIDDVFFVAQFSKVAAELEYSEGGCLIQILGVSNLTLTETGSVSFAADDCLGSPSQTWIGLVILKLLEDARLEIDSSK